MVRSPLEPTGRSGPTGKKGVGFGGGVGRPDGGDSGGAVVGIAMGIGGDGNRRRRGMNLA